MACYRAHVLAFMILIYLGPVGIHGWGTDGHFTICRIAQVLCSLSLLHLQFFFLLFIESDSPGSLWCYYSLG